MGPAYWVLRSIASYGTRALRPYCFASIAQLAADARISAPTVKRAYLTLIDMGELLIVEHPPIRSEKWVLWQHWRGVPDPVDEIAGTGSERASRWLTVSQPKRRSEDPLVTSVKQLLSGGCPQLDPKLDSPDALRAGGWRFVPGSGWMPPT
jgi:hypothetical protein